MMRSFVVAVAILSVAVAGGCDGSGGGSSSGSAAAGDGKTAAKSASAKAHEVPSAAAASKRKFEDLEKIYKEVFTPGRTASAAEADKAIAEFIEKAGKPDKTEGDKSSWYGTSGAFCMEIWTKKGAGAGSNGTDKAKCAE